MKKFLAMLSLGAGLIAGQVNAANAPIENLLNASKGASQAYVDAKTGTTLLVGRFGQSKMLTADAAAQQFVNNNRKALGLASNQNTTVTHFYNVGDEKVIHLSQSVNDVPVFGGDLAVTVNSNNEVTAVSGQIKTLNLNTRPTIQAKNAIQTAITEFASPLSEALAAKLVIYDNTLTWHVVAKTHEPVESHMNYFVNAKTGEIVSQFDNIQTARNRKTYTAANKPRIPGTLVLQETSGSTTDAVINTIHSHTGTVYDYYKNRHNRDSYNNAGATLISTGHYNRNYVNAYWNGSQMVYGDGDGVQSGPLCVLDVVGHELTHAVTERTAGLIYQNQSGALNEAMSDIFGSFIEKYKDDVQGTNQFDWLIGEDCWTPKTAGDALRYMDNPARGQQPDKMSSPYYYTGTGDNGGVHYNSGVPNHAAYRMVAIHGMSFVDAEKIHYRALTNYLTSSSNFVAARLALTQAATDLFGAASSQVSAVKAAYDYAEVYAPAAVAKTGSAETMSQGDANEVIAAKSFSVMNAYPSPFTKSTTIAYTLPAGGNVSVKVYNTIGQLVKTLVNENQAAGQHNIVWDGSSDNGNEVSAGVYFYQIINGKNQDMKRVTMSK